MSSVFPTKSRFRRRHKRCYELSFKTLFDLADAGKADGVTLVHGTIRFSGYTIGHAWLESDSEAHDAVGPVTMPIEQYHAERGAVAERRYTLKEACGIMLRVKHHGPWHEPESFRL